MITEDLLTVYISTKSFKLHFNLKAVMLSKNLYKNSISPKNLQLLDANSYMCQIQAFDTELVDVSQECYDNPCGYFASLSKLELEVLNAILLYAIRHKRVCPSQSTLAHVARCSRKSVNEIIPRLQSLGLISKFYRHNRSCYYRVAAFFDDPYRRSQVAHMFSTFRALCLSLLMVVGHIYSKEPVDHNVTRFNNKDIRILYYIREHPGILKQTGGYTQGMIGMKRKVFGENPISHPIRMINQERIMQLSRWGQAVLSAFPDDVINHAKEKLTQQKDIRDPFAWFFKACMNYCKLHDIRPNWQYTEMIKAEYKLPKKGCPYFMPKVDLQEKEPKTGVNKQEDGMSVKITLQNSNSNLKSTQVDFKSANKNNVNSGQVSRSSAMPPRDPSQVMFERDRELKKKEIVCPYNDLFNWRLIEKNSDQNRFIEESHLKARIQDAQERCAITPKESPCGKSSCLLDGYSKHML